MLLTVAYFVYVQPHAGPVTVLVVAYVMAFTLGLLIFRAPLVASRLSMGYGIAVRRALLAEFTSVNLGFAGMVPVLFILKMRWLPDAFDMGNPLGWFIILLAALAGAVVLYPFNAWMARRGFVRRSGQAGAREDAAPGTSSRSAWGALLLSFGVLVAAIWLVSFVLSTATAAASAPSLGEAHQAAVEHLDLERATELFEEIAANGNSGARMQAELTLAWMDYRVHDRPDAARGRLSQVIKRNKGRAEPHIVLSRIEIAQHNYVAARKAANRALELAETREQARDAQILFAWAVIEEATLARLAPDDSVANRSPNPALLQEALVVLRDIVETEPGELRSSRLLLATALLLDDGDSVLLAWRSYYWVAAGKEPEELVEPYAILKEILPRWQGLESPTEDRERLIRALANSRFFDEAALVALDPRLEGELSVEAAEVAAYAQFLHSLQERMDEYYRDVANGRWKTTPRRIFQKEIGAFCEVVCSEPGNFNEAYALIRDRFGAAWHFRSGGRDLYMGHAIVDEERTIEQYGQEATFRYLRLDGLVSHGVRSWLFDQLYHVGGWADRHQIVTYRPFRVNLLLNLARPILDPEAREAFEDSIARNSREDERRAAENPYADLPGLNQRLRLRSLDGIWAEASAQGLTGSELRMCFLAELDAVWTEGPMFAHEGRHVIDFRLGIASNVELEFNAKLAETTFCRYPGIPLGSNVLHPNVGPNGHGEANLRIVQGLVAWIEAHADEIEGLDLSRPLLPQLDLLTDDQLRAAARSLDPLAGGE
jgi:hypothetical protein